MQIESDQGLRVSNVTRLLAILVKTIYQNRMGMKRLLLPLLRSKTLIKAVKIPLFTCVLRCHTISLKGKVRNL